MSTEQREHWATFQTKVFFRNLKLELTYFQVIQKAKNLSILSFKI